MEKAVQNKSELVSRLYGNRERILQWGVQRLGIFGSFSKDCAKETSDVDFFVEFLPGKKNFDNFMGLAFYLEELTGRKIELVTPQSLNSFIGKYILQDIEYVSLAA
jgi:uncharacterized protein